jgi:hypothetical protein
MARSESDEILSHGIWGYGIERWGREIHTLDK